MFDTAAANEPAKDPPNAVDSLDPVKALSWEVNDEINQFISVAQKDADDIINDSDVTVIHFSDFGSDFIKSTAQVSPDAFIQQSLQLAYFKIHGRVAPVYESASVRQFKHGRTETCRSATCAQKEFCHIFFDHASTVCF